MNKTITIEDFNRLSGQETLHPLVTVVSEKQKVSSLVSGFYALLYKPSCQALRLYCPGNIINFDECSGVLFHPDLLCGTHLEKDIKRYLVHCRCKSLTAYERRVIYDCINEIDRELRHSIDRFTALIIVSHIGLLLDYCVRFCEATSKTDNSIRNLDSGVRLKTE